MNKQNSKLYISQNKNLDKRIIKTRNFNLKEASEDIKKIRPYLNKKWRMQDDESDRLTDSIVYKAKSSKELFQMYKEKKEKNKALDLVYLIHRWYNKQSSDMAEKIFCSYNISDKEKNFRHKTIDFYLYGIPFDLKISSFPKRFNKKRNEFNSDREFRNELIRWLYKNQSKQRRQHFENRLFIVCKHDDGMNSKSNNFLKTDFEQLDKKIHSFLQYTQKRIDSDINPFNEVLLENGKKVLTDVIFITNDKQ